MRCVDPLLRDTSRDSSSKSLNPQASEYIPPSSSSFPLRPASSTSTFTSRTSSAHAIPVDSRGPRSDVRASAVPRLPKKGAGSREGLHRYRRGDAGCDGASGNRELSTIWKHTASTGGNHDGGRSHARSASRTASVSPERQRAECRHRKEDRRYPGLEREAKPGIELAAEPGQPGARAGAARRNFSATSGRSREDQDRSKPSRKRGGKDGGSWAEVDGPRRQQYLRNKAGASSIPRNALGGSYISGERQSTQGIAPHALEGTNTVATGRTQCHADVPAEVGRSRRRRRTRDGPARLVEDRDGGDPPPVPRSERVAALTKRAQSRASASSREERRRDRKDSAGGKFGDSATVNSRFTSPQDVRQKNGSGRRRHTENFEPAVSRAMPVEEDNTVAEEAFPALPVANGRATMTVVTAAAAAAAAASLPEPPEGESTGLSYSSLTEKLAAEASAAVAAARSSDSRCDAGRQELFHLSVLPGFGEGQTREARLEVKAEGSPSAVQSREILQSSESERVVANESRGDGARATASQSAVPRPPSSSPVPLPHQSATRFSKEKKDVGTSSATAALRARLRERWFRLEALKKAERQRETGEKELMAAEDRPSVDTGCEQDTLDLCKVTGTIAYAVDHRRSGIGSRKRSLVGDDDVNSISSNSSRSSDSGGSGESENEEGYSSGGSNAEQGQSRSPHALPVNVSTESDKNNALAALRRAQIMSGNSSTSSGATDDSVNCTSSATSYSERGTSLQSPANVEAVCKPISAAGAAAIRRSEIAAAESAREWTQTTSAASASVACTALDSCSRRPAEESPSANSEICTPESPMGTNAISGEIDSAAKLASPESDSVFRIVESVGGDNRVSGDGSTPGISGRDVSVACEGGMGELLNNLLVRSGGRAADGKDKLRRTPLHLAAEAGSLECVTLLLKQGTRLDQRDRWRETPLHKAARCPSADVVNALCAARMKVNVRNRNRETPLLLAVQADSVEAVAALLAFGARLDDPDVNGVTPVCQAAMNGQAELLMAMANSNQACRKSSTRESSDPYTVMVAASADQSSFNRGGRSVTKRRAPVLSKGHGLRNAAYGGGARGGIATPTLSAVHEAAGAGQQETLALLLQLGVSLDERDAAAVGVMGDTPLGRAVRAGHVECARLLLDAGAMIGRENARGETPLVVAIRAGRAAAVELLALRGAPLDGGSSHRSLTTAEGHAPTGAVDKMMARRRAEPLELALREGQLACAAVLIEGGAKISERALRAVKLESTTSAKTEMSATQKAGGRYAGKGQSSGIFESAEARGNAEAAAVLPLQTDILSLMCTEVSELAESAPLDGGGLAQNFIFDDCRNTLVADGDTRSSGQNKASEDCHTVAAAAAEDGMISTLGRTKEAASKRYVGGLLPALGDCDVVLLLDDGYRLPVHSCLLAAFSATFRDLFLGESVNYCRGRSDLVKGDKTTSASVRRKKAAVVIAAEPREDERQRANDIQALLVGSSLPRDTSDSTSERRPPVISAAAAVLAVTRKTGSIASDPVDDESVRHRQMRAPAIVDWGLARGDIIVRHWGVGTMAAVVEHVYTGRPPTDMHADGAGRLLAASVSLGMPRLMRQMEHILAGTLTQQKAGTRSAQHDEAARLLRAARALGTTDLEARCTLHLQANGGFPAVMKLRRELGVPSLNSSDVSRGMAHLHGSGYLGSGPAHAWSSSGGVKTCPAFSVVAPAKRAVDLSFRKLAVDFDQLIPLLLDPVRCSSLLYIGRHERSVLLATALDDACLGALTVEDAPVRSHPVEGKIADCQYSPQQHGHTLLRHEVCCDALHAECNSGTRRFAAKPLVSNFSAFSHGLGWLLRTGAVADVVLVLSAIDEDALTASAQAPENEGTDDGTEAGFDSGGGGGDCDGASVLGLSGTLSACSDESDGDDRPKTGESAPQIIPQERGKAKREDGKKRFLAHSMVLGARSEKFAAMLRFVRRQNDGSHESVDEADRGVPSDSNGDVASDSDCQRMMLNGNAGCGFAARHRRRQDIPPREVELHSPFLSPRSLDLFLEFLYTGVLDPGLSTAELSELALIADEYLVPDLTRQAEKLLVECLAPQYADGLPSASTHGATAADKARRKEQDTASMPLEVLQLGVSLGLRSISVAAAQSVLLQLERVSRSEAFDVSGMTKRELVMAALEAARG